MARSPARSRGRQPELNLVEWAFGVLGPLGLKPERHHRLLLSELEALTRGDIDRLMILMPPGSAKSTYSSVVFPAWWFCKHPRSSIIAASHTADLAAHFGRQVRSLVTDHALLLGYDLAGDSRSSSRWRTNSGGEYFSTGVRGSLTGRRADLVIIDDPIKSHADAESRRQRDQLWDWYRTSLITRLKPHGRLVLVMTRWHEDDLAGRLLPTQASEWRLLRLPALAEAEDPLGRLPGEPLWPEWEGLSALLRKRDNVGERAWAALFQQRPRPAEGGLFRIGQLEIVDAVPEVVNGRIVRAWDLAASVADGRNDPDWTVGLKLLQDADERWTVIDVVRFRGSPREVEDAIVKTAATDGPDIRIGLPEDPGQAGKSQVAHLARRLGGYLVSASRETGSKVTRAGPVAAQVERGNILVVRASWNGPFLEELSDFPFGRKDDQVDALCRAFGLLTNLPESARRLSFSLIAR